MQPFSVSFDPPKQKACLQPLPFSVYSDPPKQKGCLPLLSFSVNFDPPKPKGCLQPFACPEVLVDVASIQLIWILIETLSDSLFDSTLSDSLFYSGVIYGLAPIP